EERVLRHPLAAQVQGLARALRDAHAQAADRHPRPDAEDGGRAHAHRPAGVGGRQHPVGISNSPRVDSTGEMGTSIMANSIKGILGHKLGMTQVFDASNRVVPVTVVAAGPVVVTAVRTAENDGYNGVQLAFGAIDPRRVTKPVAGHFAKAGVTPRRHLAELRTEDIAGYEVGQELTAEQVFEAGADIDVTGTSKGKG